jgi:hypothetical protein
MIKSKRMKCPVARMGETRNACRLLVGKPEGKGLLGRPRRRRVDHNKIDLRSDGMGWTGLDWIDLAEDRNEWMPFVNTVMNLRVS